MCSRDMCDMPRDTNDRIQPALCNLSQPHLKEEMDEKALAQREYATTISSYACAHRIWGKGKQIEREKIGSQFSRKREAKKEANNYKIHMEPMSKHETNETS